MDALTDAVSASHLDGVRPRVEYARIAPGAVQALRGLDAYAASSGLESALVGLFEVRAPQVNECAYRIDMHTKDSRAAGESEQRLYALAARPEAPFFTPRERAALAWADALTSIEASHVRDAVYERARRHFTEKELVDLAHAVVAVNGRNRIALAFRAVPGTRQPKKR